MRRAVRPEARLEVYPEHRYGLVQFRGPIDADDMIRLGDALVSHPDWEPGFTEVWDILEASVDVGPEGLRALSEAERRWKDQLAGSRTVAVVDRPSLLVPLRFYSYMVAPLGRKITVCESPAAAAAFLGLASLPSLLDDPSGLRSAAS